MSEKAKSVHRDKEGPESVEGEVVGRVDGGAGGEAEEEEGGEGRPEGEGVEGA